MSWKEGFNAALLKFVQEKFDKTAVEVTGFEERTCEGRQWSEVTFEPSSILVEFTYRDNSGRSHYKEWEGGFAELINALGE